MLQSGLILLKTFPKSESMFFTKAKQNQKVVPE